MATKTKGRRPSRARPHNVAEEKETENPKGSGRKLLLDDTLTKLIQQAKQLGLPDAKAAAFTGIGASTLAGWKATGEEHRAADPPVDSPFARLIDAMEKGKADFCAASLARINAAAKGGAVVEERITRTTNADGSVTENVHRKLSQPQWTADAWLQERSFPEEFGRTYQSVELSGKDGGKIEVSVDSWAGIARLAETGAAKK